MKRIAVLCDYHQNVLTTTLVSFEMYSGSHFSSNFFFIEPITHLLCSSGIGCFAVKFGNLSNVSMAEMFAIVFLFILILSPL